MKAYRLDPGETTIKTFFRGTLRYYFLSSSTRLLVMIRFRYPGFSSLMQSFATLGLLSQLGTIELADWGTFVNQSLMLLHFKEPPPLSSLIPPEDLQYLHESLTWLGLAKSSSRLTTAHHQMPPLPRGRNTPLEIFAYLLSQKLKYQPLEADMVVLSHEVITRKLSQHNLSASSSLMEVHTSTLCSFQRWKPNVPFQGTRPASAMARTVGLPLAIASLLVLDGKVEQCGVQKPTWPQIYIPILDKLRHFGLGMKEESHILTKPEETVAITLAKTNDATRLEDAKSRVLNPQNVTQNVDLDLETESDWKQGELGLYT
jgi:alpha-aminoadipic semialdehyde synthase